MINFLAELESFCCRLTANYKIFHMYKEEKLLFSLKQGESKLYSLFLCNSKC